ncbi:MULTISPECIES: cytochrome c-type biogenesis protein CcmH [unclassified Nocardioides]|uniref:cytochrome c-type biogenesis protein n=1 Tax=unclassified Nocardioides TaxID=2615069 RepID=UPI0000EB62A3|nr:MULTISPECIES: cytochrome c-type biogenesis protein CcmH [unclassified Nocardioides]ABL81470.1 cytochrome C biogenesis protein [Nocardioides sp. JS614]
MSPARPARPSGGRLRLALAALVLMATAGALVWGAATGRPPTDEERATAIAAGLRCPVCTDLSAADSSAPLARQMRTEIRQQVAAGVSDEEIRRGFVEAYGPSVLLTPPADGIGRVAHLLPVLVLAAAAAGGATVLVRGRRSVSRTGLGLAGPEPGSPTDRALVDRALADLLKEES